MERIVIYLFLLLSLLSCRQRTEPRSSKEKEPYSFNEGSVQFTKDFEGGYFTSIDQIDSNFFEITSVAEDYPIDRSPTYAFKLITKEAQKLKINIHFKGAMAPGTPKYSEDGKNWEVLPAHIQGSDLLFNLETKANDTIWLARHHLYTSRRLKKWMESLEADSRIHTSTCGESLGGRPMYVMDIFAGDPEEKEVIVFTARQHPTEVPGQYVFSEYVESILEEGGEDFFNRYRLVCFPMMNPDAVDMGRWRHNLNGMDLNRHWVDNSEQPENKAAIDWLHANVGEGKMKFAIDFHSRDGENAFYVTKRDLDIVSTYSDSINNRKPVLSYVVLDEFPSFSKVAVPNYSNTWFNKMGVPILIHETTHDVHYNKAVETADVAAKAFIGFLKAL